jgi:hypothetical protein
MAEVFGVISGGLSVVSVVVQLADSIKKLRDFCDLVKEAPDEIRLVLDEVEALSYFLQEIECTANDSNGYLSNIEAAVQRSMRLCQVGSDSLSSLAADLQSAMASKKRWASLKAALKNEKLMKLRVQLEGSKTTLMLANQCYYK